MESRERSNYSGARANERKQESRASASAPHSSHSSQQTTGECYFCHSKRHATHSCDSEKTLVEKKKLLGKDMRCFRCTTKGHRARDCKRQLRCPNCNGRHAITMCDPSFTGTRKENMKKDSVVCVSSSDPKHKTSTELAESNNIHLQTFRAWAISETGSSYFRGIIDGGSRRSFIKEDIARCLSLRILRKMKLALNTFTSTSSKTLHHSNVVEVRIRSQYNETECTIEAITIPVICQDIATLIANDTFARFLRD